MEIKVLEDVNGKPSAKRLWAGRYLLAALFMAVAHFLAGVASAIFGFTYAAPFPFEIWIGMVGGGFGILGVTIFESRNK